MRPVPRFHPLIMPDPLPTDGPLIDVCIPLYNDEKYISESIESVISQTYKSIRVVVLDDCSIDRSHEIAKGYAEVDPRVLVLRNTENLGLLGNQCRLMELASAPLVMIGSSDDRLYAHDALARLSAAIQSEPGIVLATAYCGYIDGEGERIDTSHGLVTIPSDVVFEDKFLGDYMLSRTANCIDSTSVVFRRECLPLEDMAKIGGISPGESVSDDIMWWLNVHSRGKVAFINDVLSEFRKRDGQESVVRMKSIEWVVGMFKVLLGARNLGYLADESLYLQALSSLFCSGAVYLENFEFSNPPMWSEWESTIDNIVEEISRIGLGIRVKSGESHAV